MVGSTTAGAGATTPPPADSGLRIAFVSPTVAGARPFVDDGNRWPLALARTLTHQHPDWTVEMVTFGPSATSTPLAERLVHTVLAHDPTAQPDAWGLVDEASWQLPGVLGRADLVHVFQPLTRTGEVSVLAARALGSAVVASEAGLRSSQLGASLGLLELADRVVCTSEFGLSTLPATDRAVVVPGGVDTGYFAPGRPTDHRAHLLFAGRLLPQAGVDRVIDVLPDHMSLVVCGRAGHTDYVRRLTRRARGKAVEFVTDADDEELRRLYRHAWATVHPAVYRDCFGDVHQQPGLMGLTVLESMACATPAIVSDVGALPELVDHGVTGVVTSSLEELEKALHSVYAERGRSIRMGLEARRRVVERFSVERQAAAIGGIYTRAVAHRRSVRS